MSSMFMLIYACHLFPFSFFFFIFLKILSDIHFACTVLFSLVVCLCLQSNTYKISSQLWACHLVYYLIQKINVKRKTRTSKTWQFTDGLFLLFPIFLFFTYLFELKSIGISSCVILCCLFTSISLVLF